MIFDTPSAHWRGAPGFSMLVSPDARARDWLVHAAIFSAVYALLFPQAVSVQGRRVGSFA